MAKTLTTSTKLENALDLPNGARFYKCAFQVNPFSYQQRHGKPLPEDTEDSYNQRIVDACNVLGIEVVGVTDHYRVEESQSLVQALQDAGIIAFKGFEAVTKDGVHFLCLFNPDVENAVLERIIGFCGIHDLSEPSPLGDKDTLELLPAVREMGGICIAAHIAAKGGLLKKLEGQTRIRAWTCHDLLAGALAGPIDQAPTPSLVQILKNKDAAHRRERPLAIINAQDVNGPTDLAAPGASCFIKMSDVSIEGLRQAFLDPESRIRLNSDPMPDTHTEFLALAWEGGFLDGARIHFNANLNVLIGGRGTGKSTIIESLRYVLGMEPNGDEARKAHDGVIKHVLRSGTKVSLLVQSPRPSPRTYTIERTVPNPPVVKDETGALLDLSPIDIVPGVDIYGQHEISELTRSREKLTVLLNRFTDRTLDVSDLKRSLRLQLERSRSRILETRRELSAVEERLAVLPSLEETLTRFRHAGIEERLQEKSLLVREERIIASVMDRLEPFQEIQENLDELLPIDTALVNSKSLHGLPNAELLLAAGEILEQLSRSLKGATQQISAAIREAQVQIDSLKARWKVRQEEAEATYESALRDLQKDNVDGEEFIRLRRQIEELRPLRDRYKLLTKELRLHEKERRTLLAEWEDAKAAEFRGLEAAAKRVSRKLANRVRVKVVMSENRQPFDLLLKNEVGGNLSAALDRLRSRADFSLPEFTAKARDGKESLIQHYNLSMAVAERISGAGEETLMRIEELELAAGTRIQLNTSPDGASPTWQSLEELSTGQKATAVLLLLLLESEVPLVVDQPEDDLDNRFITEGVVPTMRHEKRRRQFIFSTHNANIPVLGDAELIVALSASGAAEEGGVRIAESHMASIDAQPVRELVEEILEGGKNAFETRRLKYGF